MIYLTIEVLMRKIYRSKNVATHIFPSFQMVLEEI